MMLFKRFAYVTSSPFMLFATNDPQYELNTSVNSLRIPFIVSEINYKNQFSDCVKIGIV